MKTIATFTKPEDAHLLRMRLEACGIPAYLQDENMIQTDLLYSNALGGVRLQVSDEDLEAARVVLAEKRNLPPAADSSGEADSLRCYACGGAMPLEQSRCAACGWSYEDKAGGTAENP